MSKKGLDENVNLGDGWSNSKVKAEAADEEQQKRAEKCLYQEVFVAIEDFWDYERDRGKNTILVDKGISSRAGNNLATRRAAQPQQRCWWWRVSVVLVPGIRTMLRIMWHLFDSPRLYFCLSVSITIIQAGRRRRSGPPASQRREHIVDFLVFNWGYFISGVDVTASWPHPNRIEGVCYISTWQWSSQPTSHRVLNWLRDVIICKNIAKSREGIIVLRVAEREVRDLKGNC